MTDTSAGFPTHYAGRRGPMFRLALKTGFLTIITLGFYRFWMKTRMRRYYWSAVRPGGVPMEYVGRGSEKLLGFLTAVVILAFYIGVVNLILMFFSFSFFQANAPAYLVSFVGVLPLIFFAQYRARRYVLARTRWRGIRFGLEPGVKGYVWRAAVHWLVTLLTLGLLWPRMVYWLEKYRTDRTWYGDHRMDQSGGWGGLMKAAWQLIVSTLLALGFPVFFGVIGAIAIEDEDAAGAVFAGLPMDQLVPILGVGAVIGSLWWLWALAYWKAKSFKHLTEGKRLGEMGFRCAPRTGTVFGIYLGGSTAMSALFFVYFLAIGLAVTGLAAVLTGGDALADEFDALAALPAWILSIVGIVIYFATFLMWSVLRETFITLPLVRHFAETTELTGVEALGSVRQRDRDKFAEAEGFADALPLGGGF